MYRLKMELCSMCLYQNDFETQEEAQAQARSLREANGEKDLFGHDIKITIESMSECDADPANGPKLWYAYQTDADDNDWGTGTYDADEARAWLEANPTGRIAVIEIGPDPICVDEWNGDDFQGPETNRF